MSPVNHRIQFGDSNSVYSLPVLVYESMAADKADNCEYKNDQRYNRNEKLALLAETEKRHASFRRISFSLLSCITNTGTRSSITAKIEIPY